VRARSDGGHRWERQPQKGCPEGFQDPMGIGVTGLPQAASAALHFAGFRRHPVIRQCNGLRWHLASQHRGRCKLKEKYSSKEFDSVDEGCTSFVPCLFPICASGIA